MKKLFLITFCIALLFGCAAQNQYKTNLGIESEFAALAEQYEVWYQMADVETQAAWAEVMDPMFIEADALMDEYHNLLVMDMDTSSIIAALNRLKTRIMMRLVELKTGEE